MEHCRLQIGCLLIVVYIGFIYIRECKRYHIKLSSNIIYKILILSTFSIIFDGTTSVTVNYLDHVNPILNKALHLIYIINVLIVVIHIGGLEFREGKYTNYSMGCLHIPAVLCHWNNALILSVRVKVRISNQ